MTRVLIADGLLSVRHRLRQMLERKRDIQVVGEASDASSAFKVIGQLRPDVLLIDLGLCQQSAPPDLDLGGSSLQRTIVMLAAIDNACDCGSLPFWRSRHRFENGGSSNVGEDYSARYGWSLLL